MIKAFLKRLKSQKGMSGVLVALLLVIVGVGLIAGIAAYMNSASTKIQTEATKAIDSAVKDATNQGGN